MLIYSGTKTQFDNDVINHTIAQKIEEQFTAHSLVHNNESEFQSWENSLVCMHDVLNDPEIEGNIKIAIEYQIPLTAKRVDFLIGGKDDNGQQNVIIVELKQWGQAQRTSRDGIVTTYLAGSNRAITHPSYQAYSYAKTIENFNATVQDEHIGMHPCAYLHNYKEEYRSELDNYLYCDIIKLAPLHLKNDADKLREFIKRYVKKADEGNLLYNIDNGKIRPSKALQDSLVGMLNGNQEFIMIDEQKVAFETIKSLVKKAILENKKYTVIVEGGPGTGKSVIAINLLVELRNYVVNYVTKNSAPRNIYFEKLKRGKFKLNYIKNLFKGSGQYIGVPENTFDCLIVDEAHRLNEKSGIFQNKGENQIKEIIQASKVSVFFIDENQVVTAKDIGSTSQIKYWANVCGSTIYYNQDTQLVSQFRCNGSDGYIAFVDNMLGIRHTANFDGFDIDYDLQIFNNPNDMRNALREKNGINNKSRMIAGYCYEWKTKQTTDQMLYDIELEGGFRAKWNFSTTSTWAIDEDSFEQVGCIHTSQGLEFDYVGVIIGKDLKYVDGQVITDPTQRAKSDQSLKGSRGDKGLEDRIIRNTYRTLLTRGQKGCYIYCEDKQLSEYLKKRIGVANKSKKVDEYNDLPF